MAENNDELLDYEEQEDQEDAVPDGTMGDATTRKDVRGTYVSIHSSGFRDFLLKPELLRAIVDCGFEHPSEGLFLQQLYWLQIGNLTVNLERLPHWVKKCQLGDVAAIGAGKFGLRVVFYLSYFV